MILYSAAAYIENISKLFTEFGKNELRILFIVFLAISVLLWLVNHVFMAIGLHRLAKRGGYKYAFLAWIPFANFYLMGKLAGKTTFFGMKIKNVGLIVMLTMLVSELLSAYVDFCTYFPFSYKLVVKGVLIDLPTASPSLLCEAFTIIAEIAEIVLIFFELCLLFAFFRKYSPGNSLVFALLSFFITPLMGIFVFVCRNKQPVDFNEYMRRQRYEYYRRNGEGQNYNSGSGNPYGDQGTESTRKPPEDPFKDFPDDKSGQSQDPFDGSFN